MMTRPTIKTGTRLAALALCAGAALGLAACEEHAYPSAAPQEGTAAPTAGDAALAGAPSTRTPDYAPPPPGYGAPGYPPPPPGYGRPGPASAPEIITMAPIPNPPEAPIHHGGRRHRHHYLYGGARSYTPYSHARHHHHNHSGASAWVFHPATRSVAPHAATHHPVGAAGAQLTKPQAPLHGHGHHAADAATAAAAAGGPVNGEANSNTVGAAPMSGSEAERYGALQRGLQDLFANNAKLDVPGQMDLNQPATVTLTLPADFAQATQAEVVKDGVSQAPLSLNIIAALSGDGYAVVPVDAQSLPLTLNAPTVFQWRVTPTSASRSPLKVSAKAQAAGDSHTLDLGTKTTGSGFGAGRWLGLGLLAVIVVAVIAWFTRPRRAKPVGAARRPNPTNGTPT